MPTAWDQLLSDNEGCCPDVVWTWWDERALQAEGCRFSSQIFAEWLRQEPMGCWWRPAPKCLHCCCPHLKGRWKFSKKWYTKYLWNLYLASAQGIPFWFSLPTRIRCQIWMSRGSRFHQWKQWRVCVHAPIQRDFWPAFQTRQATCSRGRMRK